MINYIEVEKDLHFILGYIVGRRQEDGPIPFEGTEESSLRTALGCIQEKRIGGEPKTVVKAGSILESEHPEFRLDGGYNLLVAKAKLLDKIMDGCNVSDIVEMCDFILPQDFEKLYKIKRS